MGTTTSTDEAAEDGEGRLSAADEGTDHVLTVGDDEVAAGHLGAAEQAMMRDLEQEVQPGAADRVDDGGGLVEGRDCGQQDCVVDEEIRWQRRLLLYDSDVELYEGAKAEGFSGKWTDELFRELSKYAVGVVQAMLVSGEIYGLVAEIGRPVYPSGPQREMLVMLKMEREALAFDVVAEAFVLWMRFEANGTGWNSALGKALPGYLVDLCKRTFSNAFRDWQKAQGYRLDRHGKEALSELAAGSFGLSIEEVAEMRGVHGHGERIGAQQSAEWYDELIERLWSQLKNSREKTIVGMLLAGNSHKEIAEELGTTPKAVSRAWDRIKQRAGNE